MLTASCAPGPGRLTPAPTAGFIVLPPGYDPHRAYPVVELLPPTGSTAEAILQIYLSQVGLGELYRESPQRQLAALWPYLFQRARGPAPDFLLILARGRGRSSEYRTEEAWARTIERYERQVLADLDAAGERYRIDRSRVALAGFSLGGDLAWAIALRHPDRVHGAIVMASRASYRPTLDGVGDLERRGARFFLTMGGRDSGTRRRMARAAADQLDRWGVAHRFEVIPRLGHGPAPLDVFARALEFVLAR